MEHTFEYETKKEREKIIEENKDKYLIAEKNLFEGNFLVFSDNKPIDLKLSELVKDINDVAEMTVLNALDKDDIAEMLLYALQRIDELEEMING